MSGARVKAAIVVLAVLSMAPTAGDIGGCGSTATLLDVKVFAAARKDVDCQRCQDCGLSSARCTSACDAKQAPEVAIPATCQPLYHDGEVCLRALGAASCADYTKYVSDDPSLPGECQFCKTPAPLPTTATLGDGGP